jgi:hypothetical protein
LRRDYYRRRAHFASYEEGCNRPDYYRIWDSGQREEVTAAAAITAASVGMPNQEQYFQIVTEKKPEKDALCAQ